ncbi:protein with unknown function [Congregibacter litoralis KT71]|uniref:Two component regulator three Y domain-containing protein n=1 Tax=Congregibacter litoralis KT71 TaxID=314285 RepID=A4A5Q0_9GAMM|nr:protein with unknown function [Congregibacter litoralis KT71]
MLRLEDTIEVYRHASPSNAGTVKPQVVDVGLRTQIVATNNTGLCGGTSTRILCNLTEEAGQRTSVFSAPEGKTILAIAYIQSKDQLCVYLSDNQLRVFSISGLGQTKSFYFPRLLGNKLRTLEYANNHLFFGTDRGLFFSDLQMPTVERVETNKYSSVTGLSITTQGLWVLSESGMGYLAATQGRTWQGINLSQATEVLGFAQDGQHGVFIASYDGIFYWNRAKDSHTLVWPKPDVSTPDPRVTALGIFEDSLFVGTFSSGMKVFRISEDRSITATATGLLANAGVTSFLPLREGMLIGTYKRGLKYLKDGAIFDVKMPLDWRQNPSPVTSITSLGGLEKVVFTTEDHVVLLCLESLIPYSCSLQLTRSSFKKPRILSSEFGEDGTIWLGTLNHGMMRTSVSELTESRPLSNQSAFDTSNLSIYSLNQEDSETLWAATNNGLLSINVRSGAKKRLGKIHGLSNLDFNHGASLKTEMEIFFGGHFGYDMLDQSRSKAAAENSNIWLRAIAIDGQMYRSNILQISNTRLFIQANQHTTDFHLTVNDYRRPLLNQYEHKLEGFDKEWQNTGSVNVVTYQNLPPGDYVFRARGADSAGVWSDNEISLPISVLPPVWRTWWALAAYLLLAAVLFKYLKAWNDRNVAQRERLKLAEEGNAAFSRLEDDYQAQREANEVLLLRRTSSAQQLLDAVEAAVNATLQDAEEYTATAIANRLSVLRSIQLFTDRTTTTERTDVHALTNEITASLAQSNEVAARAIITNDVSENPVPLEHALYLGLVIQEALELAIMGRRYDGSLDPLIYIAMAPPTRDDRSELQYQLRVEDSGLKHDSDAELERHMPFTLHLIESGGGKVADDYDAGNSLTISLSFTFSDTALQ